MPISAARPRRARLAASLTIGSLACGVPLLGSAAAGASPGDVTVRAVRAVELVRDGGRAVVRVRLDVEGGGSSNRRVSVGYRTDGGTATAGADYRQAQGTVVFPAGTPSGTVRSFDVPTRRTSRAETAETIGVRLTPSPGATLRGR
jgi:beta-glucosidase